MQNAFGLYYKILKHVPFKELISDYWTLSLTAFL